MGLTITAYKNLQPCTDKEREETHDWLVIRNELLYLNWLKITEEGVFCLTPKTTEHSFSYSYGYYSDWITQLCWILHRCSPAFFINAAHEPIRAMGPFIELIQFANYSGWIGPSYSKKLYDDFLTYDLLMKIKLERLENSDLDKKMDILNFKRILPYTVIEKNQFIQTYNELTELFEIASANGYVHYH